MRGLVRSLALGTALSLSFAVVTFSLARYWKGLFTLFIAPAYLADTRVGHIILMPLDGLIGYLIPEGGPPAGLLFILVASCSGWALVFTGLLLLVRMLQQRQPALPSVP